MSEYGLSLFCLQLVTLNLFPLRSSGISARIKIRHSKKCDLTPYQTKIARNYIRSNQLLVKGRPPLADGTAAQALIPLAVVLETEPKVIRLVQVQVSDNYHVTSLLTEIIQGKSYY